MNDDLDPGPPPAALDGFLSDHAQTGEPTPAELERVARALQRPRSTTRGNDAPPRARLPPEVFAVAAVLVAIVGGALAWWLLRAGPETFVDQGVFVALEAGDLAVGEAALGDCQRPECAVVRGELSRVARKVGEGELTADELTVLAQHSREPLATERIVTTLNTGPAATELRVRQLEKEGIAPAVARSAAAAFSRALGASSSDERRRALIEVLDQVPNTSLGRRAQALLAELPPRGLAIGDGLPSATPEQPEGKRVPTMPPAELPAWRAKVVQEARGYVTERRFDEAIDALETCLAAPPRDPDCVVALASAYARRGAATQRAEDNQQAVSLYREFLEIAALHHPYRPRVEAILGGVGEQPEAPKPAEASPEVLGPPVPAAPDEETVELSVGQRTRLAQPDLLRVAVGNSDIADIRVESRALIVEGLAPGTTSLLIWRGDGVRTSLRIVVKPR